MPISKLALCTLVATAVSCGGSQPPPTIDDSTVAKTEPLANAEDNPAPDTTGDPVTADMLVSKVYAAMAAGDVDAALAYAPTIERDIASMRQAFTESFADCAELIDFASATASQPEWEHDEGDDECTGLARSSEASLLVQGRDGSTVRIDIELVTLKDGRVFVADDPTCDSGGYGDY